MQNDYCARILTKHIRKRGEKKMQSKYLSIDIFVCAATDTKCVCIYTHVTIKNYEVHIYLLNI